MKNKISYVGRYVQYKTSKKIVQIIEHNLNGYILTNDGVGHDLHMVDEPLKLKQYNIILLPETYNKQQQFKIYI